MVRITLFFVIGIGVAIRWPGVFTMEWVIAGTVCYIPLRRYSFAGAVGLITIFLCGYVRTELNTDRNDSLHFIHETGKVDFYKVRLTRYAEEREKSWRIEAEVLSIHVAGHWRSCNGNAVLYFDKSLKPFRYGDVLLVRGAPSLVKPPSNPGEFDLQRNLFFKNIYHQHYIRDGQVRLIENIPGNILIKAAIDVRLWSDRQLKAYVHGDREQATASALVLGVTDGLDSDLLQAYASTGAMHVLAVSGLHVSIIYWIILLLGKPLEKVKSGKAILAVVSVVLLWIYAFVTGWSPSVLRAVMMFTFVALARPWKQSTNIYNTMAASAFCLLVYDPFFLMSVGFQLSYIAVFGIVFIHPHLYVLWEPQSRTLDETWKVTSVSIAAQIATVPISLYYFHQFPNYFLMANLLVIPASFVVLVAGLAILPLSVIPFVASLVGFLLRWVIYIMNGIIFVIGSLPFAVVRNIYIDGVQAMILAASICALLFCFFFKNIRWLWMSFGMLIAFCAADWIHLVNVVERNHIIVYDAGKKTTIDLIGQGQVASYGDFDARKMSANRIRLGGTNVVPLKSISKNGCTLIGWKGLKIAVIDSTYMPINVSADLVVISHNSVDSLSWIQAKKIVFDGSNSPYFVEKLLRQPRREGVEVHSIIHSGAYLYSF
jgi:competence protein ComEC